MCIKLVPIYKRRNMAKTSEIRYLTLPDQEEVKALIEKFVGRRITLTLMKDPHPILPGTQGTCCGVDMLGHLLMNWDNGSTLNLISGVDEFTVEGG